MTMTKQEEKYIRKLFRLLKWYRFRNKCAIKILQFAVNMHKIVNRIVEWVASPDF